MLNFRRAIEPASVKAVREVRRRPHVLLVPAPDTSGARKQADQEDAVRLYDRALELWETGRYDYLVTCGSSTSNGEAGPPAAQAGYYLETGGVHGERLVVVICRAHMPEDDHLDEYVDMISQHASDQHMAMADGVVNDLQSRFHDLRWLRITLVCQDPDTAYGLWYCFRHYHNKRIRWKPMNRQFGLVAHFTSAAMSLHRSWQKAAHRRKLLKEVYQAEKAA